MATDSEIDRLRARVEELEDDLRYERRPRRRREYRDYDDTLDEFRDVADRKEDEIARFFRGLVRAMFESTRVLSNSAGDFADEVLERNVPERGDSPRDVTRRLPSDISRALSHKWDDALEAPRRAVDRFDDTYNDEWYDRRYRRRRDRDRGHRSYRGTRRRRTRRYADDRYDDRYDDDRHSEGRHSDYDNWSRSRLVDRAEDAGIREASAMRRSELIHALQDIEDRDDRDDERETPLEDQTRAELRKTAKDHGIKGVSSMSRKELIEAIEEAEESEHDEEPVGG